MTVTETKSTVSAQVKLHQLAKRFSSASGEEMYAVNHIDLVIEPGEMVTLLGPSGCGKTTTLRMLAGFEMPSSGKIHIGMRDITDVPPNKRDVGMVFQSYALFPHLTVYENVAYGLKIKKAPKQEMMDRVRKVLELMHLEELQHRMPSQLSGGQQQRVALARAVVTEPQVLLFDEPLSNLDAKLREYMRDELRKLQQRLGITSLYVTHDQTEAMAISDKVIIMNKGNIQQVGSPLDIYTKPVNRFVADFMGKANFITGEVKEIVQRQALVEMEGRTIQAYWDPGSPIKAGQKAICMIRPEFFNIDPSGNFTGRIVRTTYLGSFVEYEAVIGKSAVTFVDYLHHIHGIKPEGAEVGLTLKHDCVRLLPLENEDA